MNSFISFIKEDREFLKFNAFVLARSVMPQIKNIPDFKKFLSVQNVGFVQSIHDVDFYRPTQIDFDEYKVKNIQMKFRKDPDSITDIPPVIVSNDGFVLDGHHRYLAARNTGTNIPVISVDLEINKLLKLAYNYQELLNA